MKKTVNISKFFEKFSVTFGVSFKLMDYKIINKIDAKVMRHILCGYEPGDSVVEGSMLVRSQWLVPKYGCDSLDVVADELTGTFYKEERLRCVLTQLRERLVDHPAYASLTEEQENDIGGDTAELSYLVRLIDGVL